jgi:lysophospholipase L1-like esterase
LNGEGYSVRYVGSQTSGNLPDPQNEGHPGYTIDQIAALTNASLATYQPNVVLLMAGTNDMNQNYQVSTAPARLGALIDQIVAAAPNATVLVGSLPPAAGSGTEANIVAFNAQIPSIVEARTDAGKRVQFVDMSSLTTADLSDGLHPNDSGYLKMANAWNGSLYDVSLINLIQAAPPCSSTTGGCNGTGGHTPGPLGPAPGAAAQTPLNKIATGVGAPKGSKVLFADMNGDGRLDYVVVDATTGALTVWLNGGQNGSSWIWLPQGQIATGIGSPGSTVQLADLTGDGKADYIVVDPASGALNVYINGGANPAAPNGWIWYPKGTIATGVAPGAKIQFGDINGDGLADYLIVDPNSGAVQAYLNGGPNGSASGGWLWYPQGTIATGVGAPAGSQVVFADINNDGYADYLSISSVNGSISAWLNRGGTPSSWGWVPLGQLSPGAGAPTSKLQIFEADINGDGRADLLALHVTTGAVHAWLDNGLDTSPVSNWVYEGSILSGVGSGFLPVFADLNGDGLTDYALVNPSSNAISPAYINTGAGGGGASGVISQTGSWVWVNKSTIASGVGGGTNFIQLADINGDGLADYLIINPNSGAVQAYQNGGPNGSGGWIWYPKGTIATGVLPSPNTSNLYVQFADINGDGKADYLVVSQSTGSVSAYLNQGQQSGGGWGWNPIGQIASGVGANPTTTTVEFADIDADGRADYLVVNKTNGVVQAYLNGGPNGSGGWIWYPKGQIFGGLGSISGQVEFGDINGDGRDDYLFVDNSGNITAREMNGGDTNIPAARNLAIPH